jgi:hypothetical protein
MKREKKIKGNKEEDNKKKKRDENEERKMEAKMQSCPCA